MTNTKSSIVTIIDTPGQDIFYRMRNYGVSVADMVILVVSLEDGVSEGWGNEREGEGGREGGSVELDSVVQKDTTCTHVTTTYKPLGH